MTYPLWLFGGQPDAASGGDIPSGRTPPSRARARDSVERDVELDAVGRSGEQQIIDNIRAGDEGAFDALVDRYWDLMVRAAAAVLGAPDLAEDVAQDVLLRVWRRRAEWRSTSAGIRAYLLAAVRRRAIDRWRAERADARRGAVLHAEENAGEPGLAADEMLARRSDAEAVAAAIAALPERRRLLVQLRFYEGMTYSEIGEVLEISTKSAEQLGGRVLETLRRALKARL